MEAQKKTFLLTHPVWDVTNLITENQKELTISTHTSRVGCDRYQSELFPYDLIISTHTSRVGCDERLSNLRSYQPFLLTHPVWDVTADTMSLAVFLIFLLTHPVWDVTRQ